MEYGLADLNLEEIFIPIYVKNIPLRRVTEKASMKKGRNSMRL